MAAAALVMAYVAWRYPQQPGGANSNASAASAAAATEDRSVVANWLSQQTGLWIYFAYLAFLAVIPVLIQVFRRPMTGLGWLVFGGIAFEIAAWDSMNGLGAFASVLGLIIAFVLFCIWFKDHVDEPAAKPTGTVTPAVPRRDAAQTREQLIAEATRPPQMPPVAEFPVWTPDLNRIAKARAAIDEKRAIRDRAAGRTPRVPPKPHDPRHN